jgi:3-oxoacyl-(acyl-carrier-protein) synthase
VPVIPLSPSSEERLAGLEESLARFDRVVRMAIVAARAAELDAGWSDRSVPCAVIIGSARGATETLEEAHRGFVTEGTVSPLTSPFTTGGLLSSAVANDLGVVGPTSSLSMTCGSGLFAVATAASYLLTGFARRAIAGGAEAPLTPFTIAQMKALRIYSGDVRGGYPCRPCSTEGGNTLVLGEGAALFALELASEGAATVGLPRILSVGFGRENGGTLTGTSREGYGFETAMRGALRGTRGAVDGVVLHAPGTSLGDSAELAAIGRVFENALPYCVSIKHTTGHTFGAAGSLGIVAARAVAGGAQIAVPYPSRLQGRPPGAMRRFLVNAAGFGGNVVSMLIDMEG